MRNIALKRWVSAMLLLLMPWVAGAAGLGRLVILSPLGQPLDAEIDLVAVEKEELATLAVRLASAEAYQQANLQYSPVLSGVRLGIEKRPSGEPYIKIVSARPVNEAFIDLLVELSWATGRIVREYTALIDPPGFVPQPAAPAAAVAVPETRPAPALPPAAATPAPGRKAAVAATPRAKDYGPIQRGETLSAIARSVKPEGITLEQMLVGLYRSNPDAFINDNMNLVKSGKILRVPANDEVMAVTPQQADKEVRLHAADWNAYRRKLADAALAARESSAPTAGKITVRAEDKAAAKEAKDVVRLSKGEPPANGAATGEMAGRLRTLEEEAVAREKALREANERIARLEKTIQDMQRLLEIKSAGMAAAQQKAEAKPQAAAGAPEAPPAVKPETGAQPEPAPATVTPPVEVKKEEAPPAAAAPADQSAAPAKAEQPQPKPKAVPPPLPPEPGFIDTLLDEPLYLAAAGGVIVLGGLALLMARRRRAPAAAAAREPVEPSAPPPGKDVAGSPELAAAAAAAAAVPPAIATEATADEVDPLAEAEVYIAYGRDTQAEAILKEALAKNPGREDVRLKLLEIYAARPDKAAFNSGAGEFHELTGGQGESWLKVAAMGYTLDPGNPLYEAGKDASAVQPPPRTVAADLDFDLGLPPAAATAADTLAVPVTRTEPGAPQPAAISAAEGGGAKPGEAGKDEAEPPLPDFTLEVAAAASTAPTEVTSDARPPADSNAIDFNIGLPKIEAPTEDTAPGGQLAAEEASEEEIRDAEAKPDFKIDIGGIDLNLDEPPQSAAVAAEAEKDAHWYDVQTKFDLARAYQEMGDRDGAREILQEVLKEGDAQQQAEAKSLLETIG